MTELRNDVARWPAQRLAQVPETVHTPAAPPRAGDADPAPLSFQQESLWFLDQFAPGRATYNVPCLYRLTGRIDLDALRAAFTAVVQRHDSLRTSLHDQDGVGVQRVRDAVDTELPLVRPDGATAAQRLAAARRQAIGAAREPFDLAAAPLWRAGLYRIDEQDHLLVFVVHHVVSDGWSMGVFIRDLAAFYGVRAGADGFTEPDPAAGAIHRLHVLAARMASGDTHRGADDLLARAAHRRARRGVPDRPAAPRRGDVRRPDFASPRPRGCGDGPTALARETGTSAFAVIWRPSSLCCTGTPARRT